METYYQPAISSPQHPSWIVGEDPDQAKQTQRGGKRGAAAKLSTDPQSVAARERRHRISDRFRDLRSLVPGGSKMDTVSMLEEAIHYVQFLKSQIWLHQAAMMLPPDDASSYASSEFSASPSQYGFTLPEPVYSYGFPAPPMGLPPLPSSFQDGEEINPNNCFNY